VADKLLNYGKLESIIRSQQTRLRRLFRLANIPDGHAHRFRDTFVVELLLAGVPIERVSILLGPPKCPYHRETLRTVGMVTTRTIGS